MKKQGLKHFLNYYIVKIKKTPLKRSFKRLIGELVVSFVDARTAVLG